MARLRGRAPRASGCVAAIPHGHWKTTTFVAGLRLARHGRADGARRADERRRLPRLCRAGAGARRSSPATSSSWTTCAATRSAGVRDAIEAAGASLLFLPPYSPDFNPIENAFAKLKALLRKAAERTVDGLWRRIGPLLDAFTPDECANYFAAAGYEPD